MHDKRKGSMRTFRIATIEKVEKIKIYYADALNENEAKRQFQEGRLEVNDEDEQGWPEEISSVIETLNNGNPLTKL